MCFFGAVEERHFGQTTIEFVILPALGCFGSRVFVKMVSLSGRAATGLFLVSPKSKWCAREDSNLHPRKDYHLKVARLPIPPLAQGGRHSGDKNMVGKPIPGIASGAGLA